MLDGQRARIEKINFVKPTRLRVILRQGINRQIRRMFYEVGYEVKRLVRIRIGRLRLGDLPRGHWRPLSKDELKSLESERSGAPVGVHRDVVALRHSYSASARKISSGGALPTPRLAINPTATVNPLTAAAATNSGRTDGA